LAFDSPPGPESRDPSECSFARGDLGTGHRPIDLQREMNDAAVAAVIFVEQPEGLCGLTNRSTSMRVISASIADREGTISMKRLSLFARKALR
jgi:hypothetical protein